MTIKLKDAMYARLEKLVGLEAAKAITQLFDTVDAIAAYEKLVDLIDAFENLFLVEREREYTAGKAWHWARAILGKKEGAVPLNRAQLTALVGEKGADAIMSLFDTVDQIASYPAVMDFMDALENALPEEMERTKIAIKAIHWAKAQFANPITGGGINIGGNSTVTIGGDAVARDKITATRTVVNLPGKKT